MTFAPAGPAGAATVGLALILALLSPSAVSAQGPKAEPQKSLTLGEAFFLTGNLSEASPHLLAASDSVEDRVAFRALYLLGRVSLLTGDYRQSKEYFERAAERGINVPGGRWMALAGMGDALLASSRAEEAARRYRVARAESPDTFSEAFIEIKLAVCEQTLGRRKEAAARLRNAMDRLPMLSPWRGREEEFFRSMALQGVEGTQDRTASITVVVGPVPKGFSGLGELETAAGVPRRSVARDRQLFYEFGPFPDPVEATIFAQTVKSRHAIEAEVTGR